MSQMNRTDAIRTVCSQYGGKGFYLDPIPKSKLANAQKGLSIKEDWTVIGLVDATVFGSAKRGVAIASEGIVWNTHAQRGELLWEDFQDMPAEHPVQLEGHYDVKVSQGLQINMASSMYDRQKLCDMLNDIRKMLNGELEVEDRTWIPQKLEKKERLGLLTYDEVFDICKYYDGDGYYIEEMLPDKIRQRIYSSYGVPAEERIIAFINSTVFSSGKYGLAICESGIYWKNDWSTPTSRTYLAWWELAGQDIRVKNKYAIDLGGGLVFNMAGSAFLQKDAVVLMNQLRRLAEQAVNRLAEKARANRQMNPDAGERQFIQDELSSLPPELFEEKVNTVAVEPPQGLQTQEHQLNAHTATADELLVLPHMTLERVEQLVHRRSIGLPWRSIDEWARAVHLKPHEVEELRKHLTFVQSSSDPLRSPAGRRGRIVDF